MVIPSRTDDQRSLIEKPGLFCLPFLRVTVVAVCRVQLNFDGEPGLRMT